MTENPNFAPGFIGFIIMRIVMILEWLRAAKWDSKNRRTCLIYAGGLILAQIVWAGFFFFPGDKYSADSIDYFCGGDCNWIDDANTGLRTENIQRRGIRIILPNDMRFCWLLFWEKDFGGLPRRLLRFLERIIVDFLWHFLLDLVLRQSSLPCGGRIFRFHGEK